MLYLCDVSSNNEDLKKDFFKMEEENMKNTMDSIADEEEEEEEFSEDEEKLSSSTSSGSEDWPSTNVEQHGIKLSRAASKVTFKLKLILVYHKMSQ